MAYVATKTNITGIEQMLVLQTRECFYVPFSSEIGSWNEIRVGTYLSMCGNSGLNFYTPASNENLLYTSSIYGFYWGIGTFNSTNIIPFNVGCNFIGVISYPLTPFSAAENLSTTNSQSYFKDLNFGVTNDLSSNIYTTATSGLSNGGPNDTFQFPCFSNVNDTGNSQYCQINTFRFQLINPGKTGQQIILTSSVANFSNGYSSNDTQTLRQQMATFNNPSHGNSNTITSFYYTSGVVPNGGPLPIPNTLFFYCPLYNNLLRIHNFVVEKIS